MARLKRTEKSKKKPSQVVDAGGEDTGVADQAVVRKVILTDGNGADAENGGSAEAGSSGLQDQGRKQSDTDSVMDSSEISSNNC